MSSMYLLRVGAPLVMGMSNLILGAVIYYRKRERDWSNIFFALVLLSISFWVFAVALFNASESFARAYPTIPFMHVAAAFIPYFFLLFTRNFPSERFRIPRKDFILFTLPLIVVLFLTFIPRQIIREVSLGPEYASVILGTGYFAYSLYIIGYFLMGLVNFIERYPRCTGVIRSHRIYIFFGLASAVVVGVSANLLIPATGSFRYIWIGPVGTVLLLGFIVCSMVKDRLFSTKVIEHGGRLLAVVQKETT